MAFFLPEEFKKLPPKEQSRLILDAIKPLSSEEKEQVGQNRESALTRERLMAIAEEIAQARVRFVHDAIKSLVTKGDVPQWITAGAKGAASREWLQRNGYHFETYRYDPLRMRFYKGDKLLSEMVIQ